MDEHDELNDFERQLAERMDAAASSADLGGDEVRGVYDRVAQRTRMRRTRATAGIGLAAALLVALGIAAVAARDDGTTTLASDQSTTTIEEDATTTTLLAPECREPESHSGVEGGSEGPTPTAPPAPPESGGDAALPSTTTTIVPSHDPTTLPPSTSGPAPLTGTTEDDLGTPTTSTSPVDPGSDGGSSITCATDDAPIEEPAKPDPCARVEPGSEGPQDTMELCPSDTTAPPTDTTHPRTTSEPPPTEPGTTTMGADWPSQLLADLSHGDRVWAVYLAGSRDIDDPVLREAEASADAVGYKTGPGEAGCDQGSSEVLGVDMTTEAYYVVALYFANEPDARRFTDLYAHDEIGIGEVTTLCLD